LGVILLPAVLVAGVVLLVMGMANGYHLLVVGGCVLLGSGVIAGSMPGGRAAG